MDIKSPCLDNIVNGGRTGTFQKIWGLSGSFPPDRQYQDKNLVLEDIFLLIVEFSYSQERNKVWSLAEGHKKGGELGIQCFGKGPARFLMRGIPIPLSRAVNFEIPCALWNKHRERERDIHCRGRGRPSVPGESQTWNSLELYSRFLWILLILPKRIISLNCKNSCSIAYREGTEDMVVMERKEDKLQY